MPFVYSRTNGYQRVNYPINSQHSQNFTTFAGQSSMNSMVNGNGVNGTVYHQNNTIYAGPSSMNSMMNGSVLNGVVYNQNNTIYSGQMITSTTWINVTAHPNNSNIGNRPPNMPNPAVHGIPSSDPSSNSFVLLTPRPTRPVLENPADISLFDTPMFRPEQTQKKRGRPLGIKNKPKSERIVKEKKRTVPKIIDPFTYQELIAWAMLNFPGEQGTAPMLYIFIETEFPAISSIPSWQNSVRHALTVRERFMKVKLENGQHRERTSIWKINPSKRDELLSSLNHSMEKYLEKMDSDVPNSNLNVGISIKEEDNVEELSLSNVAVEGQDRSVIKDENRETATNQTYPYINHLPQNEWSELPGPSTSANQDNSMEEECPEEKWDINQTAYF